MTEPIRSRDARLRLILVTDGVGDPNRIQAIVGDALRGGLRCVQLRESSWSARAFLRACETLRPMLEEVDGLLLVNDRVDVAAAGYAHGAQVGHRAIPPDAARRVLGPDRPLGFSAHDADELAEAGRSGCDFALLSPVWPTSSKPNAAFLGVERAGEWTEAAELPVVWLGGVCQQTVSQFEAVPAAQRPLGVAVRSAIMLADSPRLATEELLAALPQ